MLARLSIVGVLLGTALPASAQVLADSSAEFSGTQGQAGWRSDSFSAADRWYVAPGEYWTSPGLALAHPNRDHATTPAPPEDQWAARRWGSDYAGPVAIDTTLSKINAAPTGTAVIGRAIIDGSEVWSQFIAGDDATGMNEQLTATIEAGSTVDFVVDPVDGHDAGDATRLSGAISAVPTPGSLALLGLAGLIVFRRKRT